MLKCLEHDYRQHHASPCFFSLRSPFFFPVCLVSVTSDRKQIDLNRIASMSSTLLFWCPLYFFWTFSIIHHCYWLPLKPLLLHPLSQRPSAIILLILKFVAMVQPSFQLCLSALRSLLFFLHEFIHPLSCSFVSCMYFHFSGYTWTPFAICFPPPSSSSNGCLTPSSSQAHLRHIKADISENNFKERFWL